MTKDPKTSLQIGKDAAYQTYNYDTRGEDTAQIFILLSIAESLERIARQLGGANVRTESGWIDGGTILLDQQVKAP